MRHLCLLGLLLAGGCQVGPIDSAPGTGVQEKQPAMSEILVKFKGVTSQAVFQDFHARYGARMVNVIPGINVYLMRLDPGINLDKTLEVLAKDPRVEYAEPNRTYSIHPLPEEQ